MKTRENKIKEYGLEIVEQDEQIWLEQGYKIDYKNDKLVNIKEDK